ncbi:lipocalin-like domain-containing protein [Rhizobium leguminosarum]|uniref:lipocalin-like domain-containing protein n=1 Tax=Rhizobium leguminosarum TaxID=384 RepID=UPI001C94C10E|nr:lipocalin-like domain-containing protein [Rhizobium leguminosarum]MBY5903928.1 lipocalin-like domain-containing protein [Rhizobium leguminosarum]MBY5910975.1 lipocalin-like domain-containing protein [Rhizobium leguminosarum]
MNSFKILAAALALAFTSPAFASDVKSPIIGAWRMTALEVGAAGNLQPIPYSGQLVFTQGGTLSVQAMNPDANAADTPYTTKAYEAYYGPVEIDDAKNIFAITVESSLVRNLIGQRLERKFEVTGDKLVISPVDAAEGWRVSYDRF